jgi:hypothetical protein
VTIGNVNFFIFDDSHCMRSSLQRLLFATDDGGLFFKYILLFSKGMAC